MKNNFRKYTKKHLISSGPGYAVYKKPKNNFFNKIHEMKITSILIILNIIVFLGYLIFSAFNVDLINYIALSPGFILSGKYLWTFLTSMFMHANLTHLFMNMVSLFFIGTFIETLIGRKRFFWFYILSGLFAGLFFVILSYIFGLNLNVYAVGASGAIFGLGGLLAILTPKLPVLVFFILPMPMWIAMIFMLGILWIISLTTGLAIGNLAHLGGLVAGLLYGFYLKKKYKRKTKLIQRYFS